MTDEDPGAEKPEPAPTVGFQMSSRRALIEIALVVAVLGAVVGGVLLVARTAAGRFVGLVPLEFDRTLGEQSLRLVHAASTECPNPAAKEYVERLAASLLAVSADHRFTFSFVVVETPEVNAFALPGGFVTVNSGLLESARTGDEVGAVLAHEMQHVLLRHGTQRMLRELGAGALLSAIFGGTPVAVPANVAHELVSDAYDRDQESEADSRGLALMVKAGLDPRGMSTFFDRLAKTHPSPPAILSTHPDPGDRAEAAAKAATGAKVTKALPSPKDVKCR